MREESTMSARHDRAKLLSAAGVAAEYLEARAASAIGPTVTMTTDELQEIAEQFGRVVALLTMSHLADAGMGPPRPAAEL
jgi:hypothetical protein